MHLLWLLVLETLLRVLILGMPLQVLITEATKLRPHRLRSVRLCPSLIVVLRIRELDTVPKFLDLHPQLRRAL